MKTLKHPAIHAATTALLLSPLGYGSSIIQNFESSTAGSSSLPSGWSLITASGTPTYATGAAGAGSNGSGGDSGLAGNVSSTAFLDSHLAGGYLVSDTALNLSSPVTGTFDFRIVNEASFDDITFMIGDIADGYNDTGTDGNGTPGELLNLKMSEVSSEGKSSILTNGHGRDDVGNDRAGELESTNIILTDDTWYRATVGWTPTSGLTGDFSITVNDFSTDVFTLTTTGFSFDSAAGHLGFGSVNDTIRVDNIDFSGTIIPEPSTMLLVGMGLLGILIARRRGRLS